MSICLLLKKMTNNQEDKKCRICGFADEKNVNIFSHKSLAAKIIAVYPIVLYEHDPLPKCICKKCIYNVTVMYNDIQRVLRTQSKWIGNVRSIQPTHNYIRILDLIEDANRVTKKTVENTLCTDVSEQTINRLLYLNSAPTSTQQPDPSLNKATASVKVKAVECAAATAVPHIPGNKSTEIKNLKSILELNGCTLLTVQTKNEMKRRASSPPKSNLAKNKKLEESSIVKKEPVGDIKPEPQKNNDNDDDDEDNVALAQIALTLAGNNRLSNPPPLLVKCRYCRLQFNTLDALAKHQLDHIRLTIPNIFEDKYLNKSERRGRLVTLQDRKHIRCLNCWRLFADNKSILDHWSLAECEFYCQICGKEFAEAPKMLREHVPAAHGISYRSSKRHKSSVTTKIVSVKHVPPPKRKINCTTLPKQHELKTEKPESSKAITSNTVQALKDHLLLTSRSTPANPATKPVTCYICKKEFQSMKARNSHMRKHKPVFNVAPSVDSRYPCIKEEPNKYISEPSKAIVSDNCLKATNVSPSTSTTKATIRGVRTKFVNPRSDSNTIRVKSINELKDPAFKAVSQSKKRTSNGPITTTPNRTLPPLAFIKQEPLETATPRQSSAAIEERNAMRCTRCGNQYATKFEFTKHQQQQCGALPVAAV